MSNDRLRASVEELRSELAHGKVTDPAVKARLTELLTRIEAQLETSDDDDEGETLMDSLRESLHQLELKHPRTAAILNRVMNALGEAGI